MSTQAYDIVKLARSNKRPTGLDYIQNLCGDFLELHGDRCYADDAAIVGGVGHFRGIPVTFVAIEKGHSAKERMSRFFGAPHPEGYRKALRLMRQAEKFHRPVLCFVDTSGAYCGIGAEERGQGQAIAENLMGMMSLNTPVITLLIGEGGSGGALALSVADRVWMLENAVYSDLPRLCQHPLKDAGKADEAAQRLRLQPGRAELGSLRRSSPSGIWASPRFMACWRTVWKRSFTCSWDRRTCSSAATRAFAPLEAQNPWRPSPW
ncbi:MAG: carboxyl transferase domain-containing protein [Evtepia gabavorous]